MKKLLSLLVLLPLLAAAQTPPTTPAPKPTTSVVQPKDSISWEKLQLNRSQYTAVNTRFIMQEQQDYFKNVKPALDSLDAQAATLINQIRQENDWDTTYIYNAQTGEWAVNKAPETKK